MRTPGGVFRLQRLLRVRSRWVNSEKGLRGGESVFFRRNAALRGVGTSRAEEVFGQDEGIGSGVLGGIAKGSSGEGCATVTEVTERPLEGLG